MKFGNKLFILMIVSSFIVTACGIEAAPEDAMTETPTEEVTMPHDNAMHDEPTLEEVETPPDTEAGSTADAMMTGPDWFSVALTNVNTGEEFTINDLKGRVILVETMAVWCTNCFSQQTQVKILHSKLGERDDFVSLGLDIDSNEDASILKAFTESSGFDWIYAVSPSVVSRDIASLYGGQFLNPPSTPMLIIDRHGEVHPLPFGIKSSDDLLEALQPFLDEEM
jgi:hypothetical protein